MEDKHGEQGTGGGREEQVPQPGPDPVHPEASRPVPGISPEELRKRQERLMDEGHHHGG
ncbi:hypothetical protein [Streptomyces sp. cmx-4-9]|uniref:hypothetical protein n=1 Tax=Streptomyces sp. cmx-4-9 TaxID=2790941 RepID=UPI003980895B